MPLSRVPPALPVAAARSSSRRSSSSLRRSSPSAAQQPTGWARPSSGDDDDDEAERRSATPPPRERSRSSAQDALAVLQGAPEAEQRPAVASVAASRSPPYDLSVEFVDHAPAAAELRECGWVQCENEFESARIRNTI